jgi:hypothetical protein
MQLQGAIHNGEIKTYVRLYVPNETARARVFIKGGQHDLSPIPPALWILTSIIWGDDFEDEDDWKYYFMPSGDIRSDDTFWTSQILASRGEAIAFIEKVVASPAVTNRPRKRGGGRRMKHDWPGLFAHLGGYAVETDLADGQKGLLREARQYFAETSCARYFRTWMQGISRMSPEEAGHHVGSPSFPRFPNNKSGRLAYPCAILITHVRSRHEFRNSRHEGPIVEHQGLKAEVWLPAQSLCKRHGVSQMTLWRRLRDRRLNSPVRSK